MEKDINAWAAKCAGCKMGKPTQDARAHAKCADPRKVRGPTQSAPAALWVRGAPSARTRAKCVDRGSIARAALSARAAIAWRGGWAALSTHLPRTCHSMPTQCNRGSTRVGRDEPQSLGTLRVNTLWPNDSILWHRYVSTLVQVMACCLRHQVNYLNQCWLMITKVQWHSSEGNFIADTSTHGSLKSA